MAWAAAIAAAAAAALAGCGGSGNSAASVQHQWVVEVPSTVASAENPAIWFFDRTDDHLLVAYDWEGDPVGSIRFSSSQPFGALRSPDGTALVTSARPASGATVIGRADANVTWARDSSHLCSFRQPNGADFVEQSSTFEPGALFIDDPATGASRRVMRFGTYGPMSDPTALSCSIPDDRAVVGESFVSETNSLQVVTLSSGPSKAFSPHPPPPAEGPQGVIASADGTLVAEGSTADTWADSFQSVAYQFTVYDSSTGTALATVPNGIVTFSDDDSRVLTVQYLNNSNQEGIYRLVDWRTGAVLWSEQLVPGIVLTRPDSGDVLVEPTTSRGPVPGLKGTVQPYTTPIIVRADGTTLQLPEVRPLGS
jgi:hypothetical protein